MLQDILARGLAQLHLELSAEQQRKLLEYIALMDKWNKVYNLTAIRDQESMLVQHILDSLSVLPHVGDGRLLDIGAGGGLPGIPLAIARPELQITLLDSNQKKTTFLRQVSIELKLGNVAVECVRAEAYKPLLPFDMVISRAFSELSEFVRLGAPHCRSGGRLLAMKGVFPREELAVLSFQPEQIQVIPLAVPGLDAQRHLVIIGMV
ncbi:MAG: 16S rRNA (guanine(527)-N(7))-methyltransferase RsmG [Sulfuricellaceae bacterium]|nr:16S rRNA (guanine(527)-N(7))-methyltransferase RsmG [Sulfuricellaceae bacterium]